MAETVRGFCRPLGVKKARAVCLYVCTCSCVLCARAIFLILASPAVAG